MLWWYYSIPVSNAGPSVDISYSSSGPTVYFHSSLFSLNREGSAIIYFTFIDPFKEGIYFFYWSICCSLLHILILILIMIRFLHDVIPTKICNEFRFSIDPIITTAASSTTPPVTDTATDPDDGFYQQLRIGRAMLWYLLWLYMMKSSVHPTIVPTKTDRSYFIFVSMISVMSQVDPVLCIEGRRWYWCFCYVLFDSIPSKCQFEQRLNPYVDSVSVVIIQLTW